MRLNRTLPVATATSLPDRYAGRRIREVSEVSVGQEVLHMATNRPVKVLFVGNGWVEVKGQHGPAFERSVTCFATIPPR